MKVKLFHFLWVLLLVSGIVTGVKAQGVHPEVQAKIDSLQQWIQHELQTKGSIDQAELEAWNAKIRETQERIAAGATDVQAGGSRESRAEVKTFSGFVGTSFRVPAGKRWEVRKITVSGGMGEYQILVTSIRYTKPLEAGEILATPSYSAEAALISDDQSSPMYTFEILEYDAEN